MLLQQYQSGQLQLPSNGNIPLMVFAGAVNTLASVSALAASIVMMTLV